MADTSHLLDLMHPMREPPPPAAITPYLVMAALGCGIALVAYAAYWFGLRRHAGLRRNAEAALAASRTLVPPERLAAQASLLRRMVRGVAGEVPARGQGPVWLQTLDHVFATRFFTEGDGVAYGDALYARRVPDVDALDHALAALIAKLPTKRAHHALS